MKITITLKSGKVLELSEEEYKELKGLKDKPQSTKLLASTPSDVDPSQYEPKQ